MCRAREESRGWASSMGTGRCEVRLAGHARVQVCELRGGHGAQGATDESRAGECHGRLLKDPSAEGRLQPISPTAIFLNAAEIMHLLHPAYHRLLPSHGLQGCVCSDSRCCYSLISPGPLSPATRACLLPLQQAKRLLPSVFTFAVPSTCHALPPPEGTHQTT